DRENRSGCANDQVRTVADSANSSRRGGTASFCATARSHSISQYCISGSSSSSKDGYNPAHSQARTWTLNTTHPLVMPLAVSVHCHRNKFCSLCNICNCTLYLYSNSTAKVKESIERESWRLLKITESYITTVNILQHTVIEVLTSSHILQTPVMKAEKLNH